MTPIWTKSQKNKMKQEKALVSWDATNAVKHRPAVPFGVVLFWGGWCCFGENDSVFAMVEPFRWCSQRCRGCFWWTEGWCQENMRTTKYNLCIRGINGSKEHIWERRLYFAWWNYNRLLKFKYICAIKNVRVFVKKSNTPSKLKMAV